MGVCHRTEPDLFLFLLVNSCMQGCSWLVSDARVKIYYKAILIIAEFVVRCHELLGKLTHHKKDPLHFHPMQKCIANLNINCVQCGGVCQE